MKKMKIEYRTIPVDEYLVDVEVKTSLSNSVTTHRIPKGMVPNLMNELKQTYTAAVKNMIGRLVG